jgi:homopolymeric O-antigen transport system permease protein
MAEDHTLVIEAGRTERHYWKDLWRYWELFYFLTWRDILVRYKQTVIGIAWALIRPFLTMVVFTIVFGHPQEAGSRQVYSRGARSLPRTGSRGCPTGD